MAPRHTRKPTRVTRETLPRTQNGTILSSTVVTQAHYVRQKTTNPLSKHGIAQLTHGILKYRPHELVPPMSDIR